MDNEQSQNSVEGSSTPPQITEPTIVSSTSAPASVPQQSTVPTGDNQQNIGGVAATGPMPIGPKPKGTKSKWFIPALVAGVMVLGGGAAAYIAVFQKSPENLWKSALSNTATGLEKYLENSYDATQEGFSVDGSFKISSPIAVDGSMEGKWFKSNGALTADIGAAGARIEIEAKTIAEQEDTTPDIYLKVNGLEGIDTLFESLEIPASGLGSSLSDINGQWFFLEHTLIDQYLASADSAESETPEITEEDMKQIADKMMLVLRERMFSVEEDKAIFTIKEKIGKEKFEDTGSYKVKVGINQDNFKEFVIALKDAAKDTKLEDLLKSSQPDQSIEEILSFDTLIEEIEKADFSGAEADVWIEGNGRYIRNIRFYPVEDKKDTNYLDFGLNYSGGDELPMEIKATIDDEGTSGTLSFGFTVNQENGDVAMSFDADLDMDGTELGANGSLSIKGSNEEVEIDKPADALNIFELLGGLQSGLGGESFDDTLLLDDSFYSDPIPTDDIELQ